MRRLTCRALGPLLRLVYRRIVLSLFARTALDIFLPVTEGRLQRCVGPPRAVRDSLLHAAARVLMVEELCGRRTLRLTNLRVPLEVVRQRGEADRKIVSVAKSYADGAIGCVRQCPELATVEPATILILPDRPEWIELAGLLLVGGTAIVSSQLADDIVPIGSASGGDNLLALGLQLLQPTTRLFHPPIEIDASPRSAQRLGEQEILVAIVALELGLAHPVLALGSPNVLFNLRKKIARLRAPIDLLREPLLQLQADRPAA